MFIIQDKIMNTEIIFTIEDSAEGGFEAKALGYSIYTQGDTADEIRENIHDAVLCHFDKINMPKLIRLHFIKLFQIMHPLKLEH